MNARAKKYSKIFMNSDKKKCVVLEKWVNGRVERRWEWEKGREIERERGEHEIEGVKEG